MGKVDLVGFCHRAGIAAVLTVGATLLAGCSQTVNGQGQLATVARTVAPCSATVPSPQCTSPGAGTPTPTTAPTSISPAPKTADWQQVSTKYHLAYDVPGSWKVESSGVVAGWENDDGPILILSGVAEFEAGICTDNNDGERGIAGVTLAGSSDSPATVVAQIAAKAVAIYTPTGGPAPTAVVGPATAVQAAGVTGAQITVDVSGIKPGNDCDAPQAKFTVVDLPLASQSGNSVVFVIGLDQGIPTSEDAAVVPTIISSLRAI